MFVTFVRFDYELTNPNLGMFVTRVIEVLIGLQI